ncbi:RNA polymerase sigma factor [Anaerolentibacter hominis]|uniref:RNA polymerase sigma factor n=1 Tax=Anaerolentibacter hominis TaxID=3079009 RepID=UPI0031B87DD8
MLLFCGIIGNGRTAPMHSKLQIDEDLIRRIGQDDREAFRMLYELSERTVYAYVFSILRNPEDTLDVVQDTFLKIRAAAHLYRPMGKPLAWIFTIARNLAASRLRQHAKTDSFETTDLENDTLHSYISDPEDRMVLRAVLNQLSEEERNIILLHAVSGLKHSEIAKSLGKPLSTVLSRYNRGLKKLKKYLTEQGGYEHEEN